MQIRSCAPRVLGAICGSYLVKSTRAAASDEFDSQGHALCRWAPTRPRTPSTLPAKRPRNRRTQPERDDPTASTAEPASTMTVSMPTTARQCSCRRNRRALCKPSGTDTRRLLDSLRPGRCLRTRSPPGFTSRRGRPARVHARSGIDDAPISISRGSHVRDA